MERPLVTFALFAFNQESFVQSAVEAAFAQTYSPLEIILTDDGSSDATYRLMQDLVSNYKGKHRVVLREQAENRGLCSQINAVVREARGELIVAAAGDDISYPQRVSRLVSQWCKTQGKYSLVCSLRKHIDANGVEMPISPQSVQLHKTGGVSVFEDIEYSSPGASHMFHKNLFDVFGPYTVPGLVNEDSVNTFRAVLLGGVLRVNEPLIEYRIHEKNIHRKDFSAIGTGDLVEDKRVKTERMFSFYTQVLIDLETALASKKISEKLYRRHVKKVRADLLDTQLSSEFLAGWSGNGFSRPSLSGVVARLQFFLTTRKLKRFLVQMARFLFPGLYVKFLNRNPNGAAAQ